MLGVYKFHVNCGRSGDLHGVFVADSEAIDGIIGTEVYFGEVLGKHSEVRTTMETKHFKLVTNEPEFAQKFETFGLGTGFNPFHYLNEDSPDSETDDE